MWAEKAVRGLQVRKPGAQDAGLFFDPIIGYTLGYPVCKNLNMIESGLLAAVASRGTLKDGVHAARTWPLLVAVAGLLGSGAANAWVLNINAGTRAVYLAVGNATANANNATVNRVSLNLPTAQVGSGTPQAMTTIDASSSTQSASPHDNYAVCNPGSGQVYVGGYFRLPAASTTVAVLQVTTPASLVNGAFSIPFNQISWTSTANGNAAADIPAGTFLSGGTLFLRNFGANTFVENCHTFTYANSAPVASGTYTGRATYTLTAP
jgi:hypothetical protein